MATHFISGISDAEAAALAARVKAADAYAESVMREGGPTRRRNYLTAEEVAAGPRVENAERGTLRAHEILNGPHARRLSVYVGERLGERDALALGLAWSNWTPRFLVTVWTDAPVGWCDLDSGWKVDSCYSTRMHQATARIRGLTYTGRTRGRGMLLNLRLTAESLRRAQAQGIPLESEH